MAPARPRKPILSTGVAACNKGTFEERLLGSHLPFACKRHAAQRRTARRRRVAHQAGAPETPAHMLAHAGTVKPVLALADN
jgi:hypothetical protein